MYYIFHSTRNVYESREILDEINKYIDLSSINKMQTNQIQIDSLGIVIIFFFFTVQFDE